MTIANDALASEFKHITVNGSPFYQINRVPMDSDLFGKP